MLFMKEGIYMNQKIIKVELCAVDSDIDLLRFHIDEDNIMDVNLNDSSCQNSLKKVFSALLEKMIAQDIKLEYQVSIGYERKMYIEVCKEYIDDINRELLEMADKLRHEIIC